MIEKHGEDSVRRAKISKDRIQNYIVLKRNQNSESKNLPELTKANRADYIWPECFDSDVMLLDRYFTCELHNNDYMLFTNSKTNDCSNLKFIHFDATFLYGKQGVYQQLLFMVCENFDGSRIASKTYMI